MTPIAAHATDVPNAGHQTAEDVAANLPDGLVEAIERDLDMTAREYIEAGETARAAGDLIEDLANNGIAPRDVEVRAGGEIAVTVDSRAEAKAVASRGAKAIQRAGAAAPVAPPAPPVHTLAEVVPAGSKYLTSTYHACTLGFWGYDSADRPVALTAGHCAKNATGQVSKMALSDPWSEGGSMDEDPFGTFHLGMYGSGYDAQLILGDSDRVSAGYVEVVGGGGPGRVPVVGWTAPVVGTNVCKAGARTGWTCGVITDLPKEFVVSDEGSPTVSGMSMSLCSASGDSGSPILAGNYAVGILSFGSFSIKSGDTEAACSMDVQVERFKNEALLQYPEPQREAALRMLEADPSRLILTGAQAITGPGQTVESLFGADFRLAVAMPSPKMVKKSATKARTVIKGKIDLMGRANTDYKVKVKVGPRSYVVTPDPKGNFTVKGSKLKSKKAKVKVAMRTHLVGQAVQKSKSTEGKIKSPNAKKKAKAKAAKSKKKS
jgi:hypothetical protein